MVVLYIAAGGGGWTLVFARSHSVTADLVILAAGTLGSTEGLLRSAAQGLPLSNALAARFSGNGAMIACTYNAENPIKCISFGSRSLKKREHVDRRSTRHHTRP